MQFSTQRAYRFRIAVLPSVKNPRKSLIHKRRRSDHAMNIKVRISAQYGKCKYAVQSLKKKPRNLKLYLASWNSQLITGNTLTLPL